MEKKNATRIKKMKQIQIRNLSKWYYLICKVSGQKLLNMSYSKGKRTLQRTGERKSLQFATRVN